MWNDGGVKDASSSTSRHKTDAPKRQVHSSGPVNGGRLATLCIIATGLILLAHAWHRVHDATPSTNFHGQTATTFYNANPKN